MRHLITIAAILAALLSTITPASAQSERAALIETYATLKPSVGALYALGSNGDLDFLCSATAVDREGDEVVILTAYHCVRKGVSYLINFGDNRFHPLRVWQIPHYEVNAVKYPRSYNEPRTDMALFLMADVGQPLVPMAPVDGGVIADGAGLAMVGFPMGIAKISYQGSVAGILDRPGSDDQGYILLQIFGAPGSSGSAVISVASGEVVGVLVSAKTARAGLPVIFATPIWYRSYLREVPTGYDPAAGEDDDDKDADDDGH